MKSTEKFIDFKKVGAIIQKNFIVMTRDKIRLIPLMIFPIVMILVLGFTTGNTPKHISTALVVNDNGAISETLQQSIAGSQTFSVEHVVSTEGEARKLLDAGVVRVIVEIPPNLEENFNSGTQQGIIVIVDESDSAIAATARQSLSAIINQVADTISQEKLQEYQSSVDNAAQQLANYANSEPDMYSGIMSNANSAVVQLDASNAILENYLNQLSLSLPAPNPTTSKDNLNIIVNNTVQNTGSNLLLRESPAYGQIKSQMLIVQQAAALVSSSAQQVKNAAALSAQAVQQEQALKQQYKNRVLQSLAAIKVFTQSKSVGVAPLVYEAKPAYGTGKQPIDFLIPSLIALTLFQGAVMGMGRAVAGEKRDGSLTRVFLTPTSNTTIISGTIIFYILFELMRAAFLILISVILFNVTIEGSLLLIIMILILYISISIAIGMIISSVVKTEQQFISMAMLISLPTMFLAGAFFPVQAMPKFMQGIASFLPVTYAGDALRGVMVKGFSIGYIAYPTVILMIFLAIMLAGVVLVFKRDIE